jgi:hypothetical protein
VLLLMVGCGLVLTGCAATDVDTANAAVCDSVLGLAGPLLGQARAQPQDTAALGRSLTTLYGALEVRDSDASDQLRGDALVLQLNVRKAQAELDAGGRTSASRLDQALATFRSRECT